jgi:hypothetical protein
MDGSDLRLVAAVYAVLQYDPRAFTPRSAEAFEHHADAGKDNVRAGEQAAEWDEK